MTKYQIPSFLLSKDISEKLQLNDQPYLILIPKSVLAKFGISKDDIFFELDYDGGRLRLVSEKVSGIS